MKYPHLLIAAMLLFSLAACDDTRDPARRNDDRRPPGTESEKKSESEGAEAVVVLKALGDQNVQGVIRFREAKDGLVHVTGNVTGLRASSRHAFHVHAHGDCGNKGENAGAHFNPDKSPHGPFGTMESHAGDFPQLEADGTGTARVDFNSDKIGLKKGERSVVGRALIVHAKEDAYTEPSGDAGERIACGVIEVQP